VLAINISFIVIRREEITPCYAGATIFLMFKLFMSMPFPSSHLNAAIGSPYVTI